MGRMYLCSMCLDVIDDEGVRDSVSRLRLLCEDCRDIYWDLCCFHCGKLPNEDHLDECEVRFRLPKEIE